MSDTPINYGHSPTPQGRFASSIDPDKAITVDDRGEMQYATGAQSGHVEIIVPALPGGPNGEERLLARNFGEHVISRIEASMKQPGYLKSGPQQTAPQVFAHYCAVAKGASLMDAGALRRMEGLSKDFSTEPEQAAFYEMVIKPYLRELAPKRR
jgi:hypothetical protein